MKITLLGAGRVGSAIAKDLAQDPDMDVLVVDRSEADLSSVQAEASVTGFQANLQEKGRVFAIVAESDLVITNPAVSRRHARLHRLLGRWVVQDLGSTSGTFVSYNGDPQAELPVIGREFALKNNSIVRFGPAAYTLLLHEGREGEAA